MSEQKMYRFHVDFGRHGDIDGVFCATPEEVEAAVGVHVWFEEPWGKHSSADCTIEAGHFSVLTDDQDFIAKAKRHGISQHGESPLGLIADMRSDGRLPPLPEIQSPITDAAIDAAVAENRAREQRKAANAEAWAVADGLKKLGMTATMQEGRVRITLDFSPEYAREMGPKIAAMLGERKAAQ